jgi:hypothetical protein
VNNTLGTDGFLNQFDRVYNFSYAAWETDMRYRLVFLTDAPLRDFSFVLLGYHEPEQGHFVQETLFTIEEFLPGEAFALDVIFSHYLIPRGGLTFTDENNEPRFMYLHENFEGCLECRPEFRVYYFEESPHGIPVLPARVNSIYEFVPEGWELRDYAEFDFDGDGLTDVVGVLQQTTEHPDYYDWRSPRILFVARGTADGFLLDFQDMNLVRARWDDWPFGDTFMSLLVEGNTFTIEEYGSSMWSWHVYAVFEYRNGWYLARVGQSVFSRGVEFSRITNDYTTGVGLRQVNDDSPENIAILFEFDEPRFEFEYYVTLGTAPNLREVSERSRLNTFRGIEFPIREVFISDGIDLRPADVPLPERFSIRYTDEFYVIYIFYDEGYMYLAVYHRESEVLNVILQDAHSGNISNVFPSVIMYDEKIFLLERDENFSFARLSRMNLDGTEREIIFRCENAFAPGEVFENYFPLMYVSFYISGGELIVRIYNPPAPQRFYRMNPDGTNVTLIGELRGFATE